MLQIKSVLHFSDILFCRLCLLFTKFGLAKKIS